MKTRSLATIAGLPLVLLLCQCARQQVKRPPTGPDAPPAAPSAVIEVKPPPADQIVKVRGRNLVLKAGRLLSDVKDPQFRPEAPEPWNKQGSVHRGTYKVCMDDSGAVKSVATLKTSGRDEVDDAFRDTIQRWRYQPTRLGNRKVPFCYSLALKVTYPRAVASSKRAGS